MKLMENVIAVEPYPVIYINDLDLMVASDLHLGFEVTFSTQTFPRFAVGVTIMLFGVSTK